MTPRRRTGTASRKSADFTAEERAAMKARAQELKAEARASKNRQEGDKAVLAAIRQMKGNDQTMARRLHEIVTSTAPGLMPKTWYGMPAYANAYGKVICFFQAAGKFKARYATFGFQPDARLDDGNMWPTGFALVKLTGAEEQRIIGLLKRAVG